MSEEPQTVFRFTAEGVDLEFAGSEAFVEKQVQRFRQFLEGAAGLASTESAPAEAKPERPTLDAFAAAHPVRQGRGSIQDRILLYTFFLQKVQGKAEVRGDDIHWCFQQLGLERPKNLHNALGILKRKLGYLQEGSARGRYQLSPKGETYVQGQFLGT
ncbi:MAG: hypothetical protein QNJ98_07330 [Planctomycetota bacterium]|nr:hypothetical protein [Planctomycetota bacterium]